MTLIVLLLSCKSGEEPMVTKNKLFESIDPVYSGITFNNRLTQTEDFNIYLYRNFFNGAGVGLGDFNNDGLADIYFCGNQVENQLYINQGNLKFKEIAAEAGVNCPDVWSTGVSVADINGDGFQDIYVCKSGRPDGENRHNELFINNGDLTFSEKAHEFGIADEGLSTHAAFFDFDIDGDLDCYLLNNSFTSINNYQLVKDQRNIPDPNGGNKLYRNDGGFFKDVTEEAGIYSSMIGFGLGVTISDINRDGWPDIYVSNDVFEKDYLYVNQHDGSFRECLEERIQEISMGSMGSDIADLNNDGFPEIFVTEMLPITYSRLNTKAVFATWKEYQNSVEKGYYHQFARNTLQLNKQDGTYTEIGRFASVAASDWSWGALIADLDNNGYKDIFIANGIYQDLLDQDYLAKYANPEQVRKELSNSEKGLLGIIQNMPSVKIPNVIYSNNEDLTFTNSTADWGLEIPSHSNGAVYGDLDNDGDLDLVVNNVNMPAFVFRNTLDQKANFLSISLKGGEMNQDAIGTKITLHVGDQVFFQEKYPMKGFMSSLDQSIHFGLGKTEVIDSIIVNWPIGTSTKLYNISVNQRLDINQAASNASTSFTSSANRSGLFETIPELINFVHKEEDFNDFERNPLLFHMKSTEGPKIAVKDINNDSFEDLYICGAKGQPGALYIQTASGFTLSQPELFETEQASEEIDAVFFDADNDGDQDLYIACGGNELPSSSIALSDRLYFNDGQGNFEKSNQILPSFIFSSSSCARPADFDQDGDLDLFIGTRLKPFYYGMDESSFLLENNGKGTFRNVAPEKAKGLINVGMITDGKWLDLENDGDLDLVVCGEWMPIKVFININGVLEPSKDSLELSNTHGLWNTLEIADLNADGYTDLVAGNLGLNSTFKASMDRPMRMYINDFDLNGSVEQIITKFFDTTSFPLALKHDLVAQLPSIGAKYPTYDSFKDKTLEELFSHEIIDKSVVKKINNLSSSVFINDKNGSFTYQALPPEVQMTAIYSIEVDDWNSDGVMDIILGGNHSRVKPEIGGYTSSYGLLLLGNFDNAWNPIRSTQSGFSIRGEIRDLETISFQGKKLLLVAKNNDHLEVLSVKK